MSRIDPDPEFISALGDLITNARKALGLSRNQVAQKAEVSHGTVDNLERKRLRHYHFAVVYRVLRAVNLDLDVVQREFQARTA